MFRPHTIRTTRPARRGNTLILTLSCLSLLAVVGITAVYFTGDMATRSKNQGQPGPDEAFVDNGVGPFQAYLSVLIYDAPDSGQGILNPLRGHSVIRTMYSGIPGATTAWDGVGAFGATNEFVSVNGEPQFPRVFLVNHRVFPTAGPGLANWFDPEWSSYRPGGTPVGSGPGQTFIPKNAAYTYPDLNNFFLASICPATGEVLVPSYVRPNTPGSFGSLDPSNPNWRNGTGVVQTVRPTQFLNPQFPLVERNADGTWTGDVRNRPGGYYYNGQYVAKNDSIWVDIGLPPFTTPSGRRVKPLVAPLVLDLDSYLNLNMHGNLLNGGAHASGQGWGKWEVSLQKVLGAEGAALVNARGSNQTRGGQTARAFDPRLPAGQQLPSYAPPAWTGGGGAHPNSLNLPGVGTGPLFATNPAYRAAPSYDSSNSAITAHPSLRNPNEWPWNNTPPLPARSFSLGDTLLFHSRHAGQPAFYAAMEAGPSAPTSLRGTRPVPFPNPPGQTTVNGYRLDPAHANRGIVTPYSAALDRSGLTPGNGQVRAANAGIAGIDMNRRLADYRANTGLALSPGNLAPAATLVGTTTVRQAEADRQAFARDIFARLIVATNIPVTDATVDAAGNVLVVATPAMPGYAALRNLAQLATNMVDYRDEDEVSTGFVWNPLVPTDPHNPLNFVAPDLTNRVVFGVEKSRLVIGEAYSEMTNDGRDTPNGNNGMPPNFPPHVRFWVELLNPGGGASGPLDDGGAQLRYPADAISPYRIEIARHTRPGAAMAEDLGSYLQDPANVTGGFNPAFAPEIRFQFDNADVNNNAGKQRVLPNGAVYADATGNMTQGFMLVAPTTTSPKADEFNPTTPVAGNVPPPWDRAIVANDPGVGPNPQNAMAYTAPVPTPADANRADFKRHVVLLRRLANPHLPESPTNPYVTVDYMDWVPAMDALHRAGNQGMGRGPRGANNMGGYTPMAERFSIGKVQPQAGRSVGVPQAAPANPTYTFPDSMVLAQNPTTPVPNQPKHTFGRHNGTAGQPAATTFAAPATLSDTVMVPFEWLPHLDRPLVNQIELIHVTTGKPHELTQNFIVPNGPPPATGILKHNNSLFTGTAATSQLFATPQMYRVLELLRVQSRSEGEAFGGRVQGLININTIQDKRVWDALFDADVNNNIFTQAQVDAMWNALIASRTVTRATRHNVVGQPLTDTSGNPYDTPIAGPTVYDMNAADNGAGGRYDRPFQPLGAATIAPGAQGMGGGSTLPGGTHVYAGGQGIDDTILRRDPATGLPRLFVPGMHPYQQAEAARKILNSTTTVSNTFVVWVTVGYFDVVSETDSPVQLPSGDFAKFVTLGNEYFREVPGDTRHKFFAIVDRTKVGLDPVSYAANPATAQHANVRPFFTTVETNANAGSATIDIMAPGGQVYSDGVAVNVGGTLVIGVGANREIVAVAAVNAGANGLSTVTLAAPLTKNHQAGECVSNVVPGNPGPQPNFDVNSPMYQPVVPHWSRVP